MSPTINIITNKFIVPGQQKEIKGEKIWIDYDNKYNTRPESVTVKVYNKETNAYEDLDLTAQYSMAGSNYTLRDLGDGFAMFDGAINVVDYVMVDYMVLANYIMGFDGGVIEATNSPLLAKFPNMLLDYGTVNGSGRITIK